MKKQIITAFFLTALALSARATMPVVDYSHIAQDAGNEVVNLAKWVKTEADAAQTQLNTLNTYENTVLQVARTGNPAALRNLPIIGSIAELAGSGQQLLAEYQRIRAMTNPQYLQGQLGSVVSAYQLPNWNPLAPGAYQFAAASYQVSQTVQDRMSELEQQRQTLERKRDSLLQRLQTASTQSEVQKYSAALTGVNGALAEVAARASELAQKSQLQQQQIAAGRQVQRQQITERTAADFGVDVNNSIGALESLSSGFGTAPHWNQ